MKIKHIEHIAINVRDIARSKDFYGRVLGFKFLEKVDCGDFDIHYYETPSGSRLELFDYRGHSLSRPVGETEVGLRHTAFQVEDVAAHEVELRAQGVEITLPTCDLPNLGARVVLFLDPNGITLEFCEPL